MESFGSSLDSAATFVREQAAECERRREFTPDVLRVLRERDRGFADLFHVLPVREPTDADTLRTLVGVQRRLDITLTPIKDELGRIIYIVPEAREIE